MGMHPPLLAKECNCCSRTVSHSTLSSILLLVDLTAWCSREPTTDLSEAAALQDWSAVLDYACLGLSYSRLRLTDLS